MSPCLHGGTAATILGAAAVIRDPHRVAGWQIHSFWHQVERFDAEDR